MPVQEVVDTFNTYVSNELPTHLLRISDMKLLTREEVKDIFLPVVEKLTEEHVLLLMRHWGQDPKWGFRDFAKRLVPFAIFSHRWGKSEPLFRDISSTFNGPKEKPEGPGYEKLVKFCEKAQEYGCQLAWADTCCIDKSSSAELEEAIRSMFRWYRTAFVCISYLGETSTLDDFENEPWFTRGWTLQELLAPDKMRFYGKNWIPLCESPQDGNDKKEDKIMQRISQVTLVEPDSIRYFQPQCNLIHKKLFWASKRKTTRIEDAAYCLLGIFDISMPIAYGEGGWAFHRLMEIIMERSGEYGIFAWGGSSSVYSAALPASPECYGLLDLKTATALFPKNQFGHTAAIVPFTSTKFGVEMQMLVMDVEMVTPDRGDWVTLQDLGTFKIVYEIAISLSGSVPDGRQREVITVKKYMRKWQSYPPKYWALGIINCERTKDGQGVIRDGMEYLCLLLGRTNSGSPFVKQDTENVLMFRSEREFRAKLSTVCLYHNYERYSENRGLECTEG